MLAEVMMTFVPKQIRKNLIGRKVGESGYVIGFLGKKKDRGQKYYWLVKCSCGKEFSTCTQNITRKGREIKGCYQCGKKSSGKKLREDMIGYRFGLSCKVIKYCGLDIHQATIWEVKCGCGELFQTRKSTIKKRWIIGCKNCRDEYRRKVTAENLIGLRRNGSEVIEYIDIPEKDGSHWKVRCKCGEYFIRSAGQIKIGKCLCTKCFCINRNWNKIKRKYRLRQKVKERDNNKCVICKINNSTLCAHHLDGWKWCKEKRYDIDNLVTLCQDCHLDFHNKYGRGENTKEQFLEYKEKYH